MMKKFEDWNEFNDVASQSKGYISGKGWRQSVQKSTEEKRRSMDA
jgi:hypothetical protein